VSFLTGVFIIILAGMGIGAISEFAKALGRRGTSAKELAGLKAQMEQYAAALQEAQATQADQAAQLAELQERVDFAERLLTQARDRAALEPGRRPEP
jgi:hypothetical protein